ncbi:MAG: type I restriction enzyme HsdR N-terminal domain-containing protein [Candidatus Latescibacteria bacterium]|nr:type I restriction enzyme HsdR N-terminal domain-containing protein [Candidatus Latescibacterota bacterium]
MALDDLKETIETLRERIQAHRAYLEGNETRTRQVLIDSMLHKLGWDVGDPNSVELEYRIGRDWADYVLMGSGRPIAVIEAKALGRALKDDEKMQALNYANMDGIDYMAITNGDHWQMFDVFKRGQLDNRILMELQLTRDEPYACALQALGLWRPNLASGKPQEAATPVMIEKSAHAESASTISEPSSRQKVAKPSNNGDWVPLMSLEVEAGTGQKPPAYIKFPDSSTKPLKNWVDLWVSVANYLIDTGKISAEHCPVPLREGSKRHLLHTEPIHSTGKEFHNKRKIGKLWLNTDFTSTDVHKHSCWLLDKFGVNPSTVLVSTNRS